MRLSDNLKSIRKENNLSQEQLAEKLGVTRQAVSKWESGQSYPEMEKVLLICKLFNYNIDELMNENVKIVNEDKQSKININKYIEDFFSFITKTVDMLSCMKLKTKLKCFFEQIVIIAFLLCVFFVIGAIGSEVLRGIIGGLPTNAYYVIRNLFDSIYIVLALIVGITILLHIFKIRYLDYYEIVKDDVEKPEVVLEDKDEKIEDDKEKVYIEKKKEKVIIRDPKHSQSKFLSGILRLVLSCIKVVVACIALFFMVAFIGLVALLILSFLFVKNGLLFFGIFVGVLSGLIINFVCLNVLYNFIVSKKGHKTRLAIFVLTAMVLLGISIGSILVGITNFNYIDDPNLVNDVEKIYELKMTDKLFIDGYNIEYIESDLKNVKIIAEHSKYYDVNFRNENDEVYIYFFNSESKTMELIRDNIKDINNKQIKNYYNPKVYVYASKSNIEKLIKNRDEKYIIYSLNEQISLENVNEF